MRIGRLNISRDAVGTIPDKAPTPKKLVYGKISRKPPGGGKRMLEWNSPEFNFKEIAMCLATESFFRRVVDKYIELIWRNTYKIKGDNPDIVAYVKRRLGEIALVTDIPTDTLFREMTQQIVTYSNAFIEKVRDVDGSSGRIRTTFEGDVMDPVAGYYAIDATSIRIAKDKHGRVEKYKQEIKGREDPPEWKPEDIIHIYISREPGLTFGTPMVVPVMDDIKALRRIEENVEMLVFHNAIPLFMYLVGDADNIPGESDIAHAQGIIRNMPTEGMIAAPYYHDVKAVGSEGRALRCEGYMEYFKNRVLAGLGASEVALGYSGSASRSAAETMERGMFNTVKEFQKVISRSIENEIFRELVLEGGYTWDDDTKVDLFFPEIDIDDMIKLENHVLNMYTGNIYTETEARERIGFEPVTEEQRPELYFNMVEMPKALIQAVDEPYINTIGAPALRMMMKGIPSGRPKLAKSLDMPSNQYGTKMSPGTTKDIEDDITVEAGRVLSMLNHERYYRTLRLQYEDISRDMSELIMNRFGDVEDINKYNNGTIDMIVGLSKTRMVDMSGEYILSALIYGIENAMAQAGIEDARVEYSDVLEYLRGKNDEWLTRVLNIVRDASISIIDGSTDRDSAVVDMINAFDSSLFRIRLGARNELQRSYNVGIYKGGVALGYDKFILNNVEFDDDGICSAHSGIEYSAIDLSDLDSIPPGYMTHPLCTCTLAIVK